MSLANQMMFIEKDEQCEEEHRVSIDSSGSMYMYFSQVKELCNKIQEKKYPCVFYAFHHDDIGSIDPATVGQKTGLTNLNHPLQHLANAIEHRNPTTQKLELWFITDGMHNASPADVLYRSMDQFVRLLHRVSKESSLQVTLHIVTCGSWFDGELISALHALSALLAYQDGTCVKITQSTIEKVLASGQPGQSPELNHEAVFKGVGILKGYLLSPDSKELLDTLVNQALDVLRVQEQSQAQAQPPSPSDTPHVEPKTFRDLVEKYLSSTAPPRPSLVDQLNRLYMFGGRPEPPQKKRVSECFVTEVYRIV